MRLSAARQVRRLARPVNNMKNIQKTIQHKAQLRRNRVRAKIFGTDQKPRLSVFRSLKHLFLQLIDDTQGKTLVSVKDAEIKTKGKPVEIAKAAGSLLAEKAMKAGIKEIVFDRGARQYHGRVQAVAEGAREAGLKF